MPSTTHTRLKVSSFEPDHGSEPKTELTNIVKDKTIHLSSWTTLNVSVPTKQISFHDGRNGKGEVIDHVVMAKNRKIPCLTSHKSPKRRPVKPVSGNFQNPYASIETNIRKNLWK